MTKGWNVGMRMTIWPFSNRNLSADERIFNYSLSRSTRVVEHALRVLAKCFQILLLHCVKKQDIATTIAFTCCCLYNLIKIRYSIDPGVESHYPMQNKYLCLFFCIILHYKSCLTTFFYDVLNFIFEFVLPHASYIAGQEKSILHICSKMNGNQWFDDPS